MSLCFAFMGFHIRFFWHEKISNDSVIYIIMCLVPQFEKIEEVV
jgi:hypothetical protein